MEKDEPEVVHLEWERVQDPAREMPPEMVVAEPEPPKPHILPRWNDPNPFRADAPRLGCVGEFLSLLAFLIIAFAVTRLVGAVQ